MTNILTSPDQKVPDRQMKTVLQRVGGDGVFETAVKLGIQSRFGDLAYVTLF